MKRFAGLLAALAVAAWLAAPTANAERINVYFFTLNGLSVNPPNSSPGFGFGGGTYDDVAHTLGLGLQFINVTGDVTQAHFHGPTATSGLPDGNPPGETFEQAAAAVANVGIAISLPGSPQPPSYGALLDMTQTSIYSTEFLTANGGTAAGAEAAFVNLILTGRTYFDIHTSAFPDGEIRGFIQIPEPASIGLALAGLSFLHLGRRGQAIPVTGGGVAS
jgi:hypothetical protein